MKKPLSLLLAAVAASLFSVGSYAYEVTFVGANPFGIPSTGGTGTLDCPPAAAPVCNVSKEFTSLGVIPIVINHTGTPGPGVLHIAETVINDSGVTWRDFHFFLFRIDADPNMTVEFTNLTNADWANALAV